jgi:sulfur carrier protein ThiS
MGQAFKEYALNAGSTIGDLLNAAGITLARGESLAINGCTVRTSRRLRDGDRVFVVPSVSGGY